MKKIVVIGVIALFIGISIIPSINADIDRLPSKSKLVETSIRIHRARSITPYTLKLTERQSDEVDRIFNTLHGSLDSVETDEEIDEIYDDAVESLYEFGMFPKMTVEEAKQFVKGDRQNSNGKSQPDNIGNADENFNCIVAGETSVTCTLDLDKPFWNWWLEFRRTFLYRDWMDSINLQYYEGKIGQISFGRHERDQTIYYCYSSKGWVFTNGTNGVVRWNGTFWGKLNTRKVWNDPIWEWWVWVYIGINDFEGLFIDKRGKPPCYLGNAEHVGFTYNQTPQPW